MSFQKPSMQQIQHRFRHHPPVGDQAERYGKVRQAILSAAVVCVDLTPCSPEQTRALNALDEAMMLFNAAIARNEKHVDPEPTKLRGEGSGTLEHLTDREREKQYTPEDIDGTAAG